MNANHRRSLWHSLLPGLFYAAALCNSVLAQAPQPGNLPAPDKVFDWVDRDSAGHSRVFALVEILNRNTNSDRYDLEGQDSFPFGERFGVESGNVLHVRFRIYLIAPQNGEMPVDLELTGLSGRPPRLTIGDVPNPDWCFARSDLLLPGERALVINEVPNARLEWGGKVHQCSRMVEVHALVQTFKDPTKRMNLWLEFKVARDKMKDGSLDWKGLVTPDFWVDLVDKADPGDDMSFGNTNPVREPRPLVAAVTLITVGAFFALCVAVNSTLRWLRLHYGTPSGQDAQMMFWAKLAPVLKSRRVRASAQEAYAFEHSDLRQILSAIHDYINAGENGTIKVEAWTLREIRERRTQIHDCDRWLQVLEPLRTIYETENESEIGADRFGRIIALIRQICPQP